MKIFLAFFIPIFIAFSGYHISFRGVRDWSVGGRFFFTGSEFLFFGLLLGPLFLNVLDETTTRNLEPLNALLTGWIGLLYGIQFEFSHLRKSPLLLLFASIADAVLTFAVTFAGSYLLLPFFLEMDGQHRMMLSIVLSSAAACSSQSGLSQVKAQINGKASEILHVLKYISSLGGITVLFLFFPVFVFREPVLTCSVCVPYPFFEMLAIVGGNVIFLVLYSLLFSRQMSRSELALVVIGMVVLTSGAASLFKFSPLLANFVVGVFLANSSRHKNRIFNILVNIEKPLYLLLIVLLGAMWHPGPFSIIAASCCYCLVRLAGKIIGGRSVAWLAGRKSNMPWFLGGGLLEQGGLALALLMDFTQFSSGPHIQPIVSIVLTAVVMNDFLSPFMLEKLFKGDKA